MLTLHQLKQNLPVDVCWFVSCLNLASSLKLSAHAHSVRATDSVDDEFGFAFGVRLVTGNVDANIRA
jgi:hypothetical protein